MAAPSVRHPGRGLGRSVDVLLDGFADPLVDSGGDCVCAEHDPARSRRVVLDLIEQHGLAGAAVPHDDRRESWVVRAVVEAVAEFFERLVASDEDMRRLPEVRREEAAAGVLRSAQQMAAVHGLETSTASRTQ